MIVNCLDNKHFFSKVGLLALLMMSCFTSSAQTNISGVINTYIDVTGINYVTNSVTVSSSAGLSVGDQVILMQMQGAVISEFNDAAFGTISNYADAGNYEITVICDIQVNDITFDNSLLNTYTTAGVVQLISFPTYTDAIITGADLTANAWNGVTGGVLALEVTGTLDFGTQNINLNNLGFRGSISALTNGACSWFAPDNTYYQPSTEPSALAFKGEGIQGLIVGKETGRGPQANGGGGGNNHNGGGGGGANYGTGGAGGRRVPRSAFTCSSPIGLDSKSLTVGYTSNKIFLAGAGGAGNGNNGATPAAAGSNGAGIVIIKAGTVTGNGQTIFVDGTSAPGNAANDGGGGAGAGGTIFLEVGAYSNVLNVSLNGGNGAGTTNDGTSNCNGPGGGGGGGLVWISSAVPPGNLNTSFTGGAAGTIVTTAQTNCTVGSTNGAVSGTSGALLFNLALNESSTAHAGCMLSPLPVEFLNFTHQHDETYGVKLMWSTASEHNNDYFTIYRSSNGESFKKIGIIDGAENSLSLLHYSLTDPDPEIGINYYRLSQTDINGHEVALKVISVNVQKEFDGLIIAPNPTRGTTKVSFTNGFESEARMEIYKITGERVLFRNFIAKEGFNEIHFDAEPLSSGVYVLCISGQKQTKRIKFVK